MIGIGRRGSGRVADQALVVAAQLGSDLPATSRSLNHIGRGLAHGDFASHRRRAIASGLLCAEDAATATQRRFRGA